MDATNENICRLCHLNVPERLFIANRIVWNATLTGQKYILRSKYNSMAENFSFVINFWFRTDAVCSTSNLDANLTVKVN